jgi:hypothetical protein
MKRLLLTTLSLLLLSQTAQAAPTLTKAQRQKLTATGVPIVLPTALPDGFTLTDVTTNGCQLSSTKPGCRFGPQSTVVYRNAENTCLLVNMINDGVGGGAADLEFRTSTQLLGEAIILIGQTAGNNAPPTEDDLQTYHTHISSFPSKIPSLDSSPYYSLAIGHPEGYTAQFNCDINGSITPAMFEQILQSLEIQ